MKLSYSCMPNMSSIIANHNKKILNKMPDKAEKLCNCRGGAEKCPLNGKCLTLSVVYKATMVGEGLRRDYIGSAVTTFKTRYNNHLTTFKNKQHSNKTTISKHIWNIKENNNEFKIIWKILCQASAYSQQSKRCNLCLMEKTLILLADKQQCLNKRSKIMNKCRHKNLMLLNRYL